MFSFTKRKPATTATPFVVDTAKAYDGPIRAQRATIERKLQGMAIHGYLTQITPHGEFVAEFGLVDQPCGCSLIGVVSFGVAFYVDMHGNAGWAENCPHADRALLPPPPPSAILAARAGATVH